MLCARTRSKIKPDRMQRFQQMWGSFTCSLDDIAAVIGQRFDGKSCLNLEIGFGSGEYLLEQARCHPEQAFVGIEHFKIGVIKVVEQCCAAGLDNVLLFDRDVFDVFACLPKQAFNKCCVLFPDPWPKKRHSSRRIINKDTLQYKIAPLLIRGAQLCVTTDSKIYSDWIQENIGDLSPDLFKVQFQMSKVSPFKTKYAQKAENVQSDFFSYTFIKQ